MSPALAPPGRAAEVAFFILAGLAWAAKIAVEAGASPWLLDAALALAAVAAVSAVALEGARWLDGGRLLLVLLGLAFLPSVYGRVGGDGIQYYVLLRSPFFDGDFDFANDYQGLGAKPVQTLDHTEVTNRMPVGTALLWLPTYALAHALLKAVSWLGAPVRADGFSPAYQATVTTTTYVYAFLALVLLEAALRRRHGGATALVAVVAVWLATPLHFYMTANPSMSHGASAVAGTLLVLGWLRAREGVDPRQWLLAGLAGGLVAVIRLQDAVLLVPPLVDLAMRGRRALRSAELFLLGPAALGLAQILVWLSFYGPSFAKVISDQSYVGQTAPQPAELLFSARHGLFTWTPVYLAAVAGWLAWARREARPAALAALAFVLATIVNSAMEDWWGSESFGQRRMVGLTPLFALGLGEAVAFVRRRPLAMVWGVVGLLVVWNMQLSYIFNSELLARKTQAVSLDRLAGAQVELAYQELLRWEGWLPRRVFVLLYDNVKGVWLDEGPRALGDMIDLGREPTDLPVIVGHNWYGPEAEGETTFRRSKGRRSWLRIPIRTPGDFEATLRLRAEHPELPVMVKVEVNGHAVAEMAAPPAWGEHAFTIPASALHPGLNDLALVYSASPRQDLPDYRGKDAAVAVDWLRLRRTSPRPW